MTLRKTFLGEEKKRGQSSADCWVFPRRGRLVVAGEWPSETTLLGNSMGQQFTTLGFIIPPTQVPVLTSPSDKA